MHFGTKVPQSRLRRIYIQTTYVSNERTRKLRSLDSPILTVGLIKFLGAKFVLDSGFGDLALIKYSTSGADAFGETPVPIPNTTVKT